MDRSDPRRLAAIYLGGIVGAVARVGLAEAAPHGVASWPWPTFVANVVGAFLLGTFVAAMRAHPPESPRFALLTTGLCGTLTTFATMQLELFEMLDAGAVGLTAAYAGSSVVVGLLALQAGLACGASYTGGVHKPPRGDQA